VSDKAVLAGHEYNLRKRRLARPKGKSDGVRWFPGLSERCDCCKDIREPSRAFPLSLYRHCCTAVHIAQLFGVDEDDVRSAAKHLDGLYIQAATDNPLELVARDHARKVRETAARVLASWKRDAAPPTPNK
jgi:hypothetical protein